MPRRGWISATLLFAVACSTPEGAPPPLPVVTGLSPLLQPGAKSPRLAQYRITASLDLDSHEIRGRAIIGWRNPAGRAVDRIPLHLYMNAFKSESTVFMREAGGSHRGQSIPEDEWGWIDVTSVAINGAQQTVDERLRFSGPDETIAELLLPEPLPPAGGTELDLEFTVKLPRAFARSGYRDRHIMVGQWFPKVAVIDGERGVEEWRAFPYHAFGEFYADFATYDVLLNVPANVTVDATGVLVEAREDGGRRTLRYRAEDVHDFAWFADPEMTSIEGVASTGIGDVAVLVYFRPEQRDYAERHLSAATRALELLSKRLTPYPWRRMVIVDPPIRAAGATGGMEYQTLVTTSSDSALFPRGIRFPEQVTVHEVGHNWFQGLLASNEVEEAWLDEGVNMYMEGRVLTELYGPGSAIVDWRGLRGDYFELMFAIAPFFGTPDEPIAQPAHQFSDLASYTYATYIQTALALRTLEFTLGTETFDRALRTYARRYQFQHPNGDDFTRTISEVAGRDLSWFFGPVFQERARTDYSVRSVRCAPRTPSEHGATGTDDSVPKRCTVVVVNRGALKLPVTVEVLFADGHRKRVVHHGAERQSFDFDRTSPVDTVRIDPDRENLLEATPLENGWVRHPPPEAPRRITSRAQYWAQTIMQVIGP